MKMTKENLIRMVTTLREREKEEGWLGFFLELEVELADLNTFLHGDINDALNYYYLSLSSY